MTFRSFPFGESISVPSIVIVLLAISFCMYKPIVEKNHAQVSALYHLFRKLYLIIGGVVLVAGLAITPFIKVFAKDYASINVNLYFTFILMLISIVITYLFGAKTALINAYKNNYITSSITYGGIVFQYILQIIVLVFTSIRNKKENQPPASLGINYYREER